MNQGIKDRLNSILEKEKVYVQTEKGEINPEGTVLQRGPKGGIYYETKDDVSGKEISDLEDKEYISKSIQEAEERIMKNFANDPVEYGELITPLGNHVLSRKGRKTSVKFLSYELKSFKDCIFIHNHPLDRSFSRGDLNIIVKANLGKAIIISPNKRFILNRPKNGWGSFWKVMDLYDPIYSAYMHDWQIDYNKSRSNILETGRTVSGSENTNIKVRLGNKYIEIINNKVFKELGWECISEDRK